MITSKTYVLDINGVHEEVTFTVTPACLLVVLPNPEGLARRLGADFERAGYVLREES